MRFIPTYVGHTAYYYDVNSLYPVHPHIRGAYLPLIRAEYSVVGSSPHTWGILAADLAKGKEARFIPTYVGHTLIPQNVDDFLYGSSPHTWGILVRPGLPQWACRFIPTYVGHTALCFCAVQMYQVHPHIRGAYGSLFLRRANVSGSSPHTWGIHMSIVNISDWKRFIPTYVGHTSRGLVQVSCGFGSSPHTWGIPLAFCSPILVHRFIPTYVGHTPISCSA